MALIVEDGSIVADANSYISVEDARDFLGTRGFYLTGVDATDETLLLNAMDYLESYRDSFKGSKVSEDQSLQWPRENVVIDGFELAVDAIPVELWKAQCILAYETKQGVNLFPNSTGKRTIREKIDVVEVEYDKGSIEAPSPVLRRTEAFLAPLLRNVGMVTTIRV